jgi:U3 small nucleolar RNA-associated protein 6
MADDVQYILDRMVVIFTLLQETELFTTIEIKSIIKKRTDYEYMLKRRELKLPDAMGYIEYELKLNELRGKES